VSQRCWHGGKRANDLPCGFYARPSLVDFFRVLREQFAPQFDRVHPVLVDQEREPAQERRAKAVGEVLWKSADGIFNRQLAPGNGLADDRNIQHFSRLDSKYQVPAKRVLPHLRVHNSQF
jgi:hypothetical protein